MIWRTLLFSLFVSASFEPSELLTNLADKYEIVFDGKAISSVDADFWTSHEDEFEHFAQSGLESLGSHSTKEDSARFQTHRIRTGPNETFLCFIPPIKDREKAFEQQLLKQQESLSAGEHSLTQRGLHLVQPIYGRTLYYKSGWFVYSIKLGPGGHMRQFHELELPPPATPQEMEQRQKTMILPQEDPNHGAYTLGKHPSLKQNLLSKHSDERALAPLSIEERQKGIESATTVKEMTLGGNTGLGKQYYLSQIWTDGTTCDITGRPRQFELQYHCLDGPRDGPAREVISSIRETGTCLYLVIVSTSRLCTDEAFRKYEVPEVINTIHCQPIEERGLPEGTSSSVLNTKTPTAAASHITPAPDKPIAERVDELLQKMAEAMEDIDYELLEDEPHILSTPELEDAIAEILAQNQAHQVHDEL